MTDAPFDSRTFRQALGMFSTGVTIVTCRSAGDEPVGMTANSFASVSLDPPLVLWSVDRKAHSFEAFVEAQAFAFSVLAQDQADLSNKFAKPSDDKFAGVPVRAGHGNVPLIAGCVAQFECTRHAVFDGGDHAIVVGKVVHFSRSDRRPLVFAQGRYGVVAPHPGQLSETVPDAADRHPYDDFLVPLLFRAYNHMFRAFSGALAAGDATGYQMRILAILATVGPTADDELLTRTMLSLTSYTEARQALLSAQLIGDDGGVPFITPGGRERLSDLVRQAAALEERSTSALDSTEVELLRNLLRKLVLHHENTRDG
ncbi:MAG: flavin reductase [Pseudomonadota bacterium]